MKRIIFSIFCICALSSCSVNKQSLGLGRKTPDEFVVMKRQPLSMPPEYNLTPPEPGKAPLKSNKPEEAAKKALFGEKDNDNTNISTTDQTFLGDIDAINAKSDIRKILKDEAVNDPANNKYLIDNLMFWKKNKDTVIDNLGEAKRLKKNKKQGLNINQGDVPIIKPNK